MDALVCVCVSQTQPQSILDRPVTVQAVGTNGRIFQFMVFQLNTTDLRGDDGIKNQVRHFISFRLVVCELLNVLKTHIAFACYSLNVCVGICDRTVTSLQCRLRPAGVAGGRRRAL